MKPAATAALTLALLCAIPVARAEDASSVTFRYRPPVGTRFVETLKTTRTRSIGTEGSQSDTTITKTEMGIDARDGGGYVVTSTLTEMEATREGTPVRDPITELLRGVAIHYAVDDNARVHAVTGFADLSSRLESVVPPKVAAALKPLLSEQALVAQAVEEWNDRLAAYADRTVTVGQQSSEQRAFKLPNGDEMEYEVRTNFQALEPCGKRSCVRVEMVYDSDASKFAQFTNDIVAKAERKADQNAAAPSVASKSARLSGRASRLIDPQTMLIYEETQKRSIAMEVDMPGHGSVPMKMVEEREYSYDYE